MSLLNSFRPDRELDNVPISTVYVRRQPRSLRTRLVCPLQAPCTLTTYYYQVVFIKETAGQERKCVPGRLLEKLVKPSILVIFFVPISFPAIEAQNYGTQNRLPFPLHSNNGCHGLFFAQVKESTSTVSIFFIVVIAWR